MAGRIAYLGNISPQGLVLDLDAAIMGSYPKTGSTWFDISNNGNNGTLTNGPVYTGSDYGAIVFDGTNDYVNITPYPSLINNLTLCFWFKTSTTPSNYTGLVTTWTGAQPTLSSYGVQFKNDGTLEPVRPVGSSWNIITSTTNVANGSWYYCTVVYNSNGTFLYLNSVLNASNAVGTNLNTPLGLRIGSDITGANFWTGQVSLTQIYNRALSAAEITQNFNALRGRYGI